MPTVSLVVCVFKERALLGRVLRETVGCYDDLVVVHDGPEDDSSASAGSIVELVRSNGGRFFTGTRSFQQEPHWPFAWGQARSDWILRLDADEIPSPKLKQWLRDFRSGPEPNESISGYTCIWPLWNGRTMVTERWPAGRLFLFHKQRVRFFGMVEQVPIADTRFEALPYILGHRPKRKSYGLHNLLMRSQAYHWRRVIVQSLLGKPTDLPCWRWTSEEWPAVWEQIRRRPLRTALKRLLGWPIRTARDMRRIEGRVIFSAAIPSGIHHCLVAISYWRARVFGTKS